MFFSRIIDQLTFFGWPQSFFSMTSFNASDVKKLKELKELADENRRLKRMYADLSLQHEALKDVIEKKL